MNKSWTQSLERINISKENKLEVVKTLVAYPLLLNNLDLKNNLIEVNETIYNLQNSQLKIKDTQLLNLEAQIKALEEEKKLFKVQLRKQKVKSLKISGIALLIIGSLVVLNN